MFVFYVLFVWRASLVAQFIKNLPAVRETGVWSLGWEDPLGKGKATHSNILAWRIPWTVESTVLRRVGYDWETFNQPICVRSIINLLHYSMGFPCDSAGKESTCNVGDLGSIPGLGRSPGEGDGYPLWYSGLENSMDCIVHGVAKSRTWLSGFHFISLHATVLCSRLC